MSNKIKYRKLTKAEIASCNGRYKYALTEHYSRYDIDLGTFGMGVLGYIWYLPRNKQLWICRGYWWDGASFIAKDTDNIMPASLVHDAIYQLIREKKLSMKYRKYADKLLVQMCKENGMSWFRRFYIYHFVRLAGRWNLRPEKTRQSSQ